MSVDEKFWISYYNIELWIQNTWVISFKCDKCDMEFDDKARLERHKQVHGRKPKIVKAGGIDFDQVGA